jgi:CRP-like cAMP-binding protein
VRRARRTATISASEDVTLLQVSSTLMEQLSSSCQLRFMRVFLRSLIERLQNVEAGEILNPANPAAASGG